MGLTWAGGGFEPWHELSGCCLGGLGFTLQLVLWAGAFPSGQTLSFLRTSGFCSSGELAWQLHWVCADFWAVLPSSSSRELSDHRSCVSDDPPPPQLATCDSRQVRCPTALRIDPATKVRSQPHLCRGHVTCTGQCAFFGRCPCNLLVCPGVSVSLEAPGPPFLVERDEFWFAMECQREASVALGLPPIVTTIPLSVSSMVIFWFLGWAFACVAAWHLLCQGAPFPDSLVGFLALLHRFRARTPFSFGQTFHSVWMFGPWSCDLSRMPGPAWACAALAFISLPLCTSWDSVCVEAAAAAWLRTFGLVLTLTLLGLLLRALPLGFVPRCATRRLVAGLPCEACLSLGRATDPYPTARVWVFGQQCRGRRSARAPDAVREVPIRRRAAGSRCLFCRLFLGLLTIPDPIGRPWLGGYVFLWHFRPVQSMDVTNDGPAVPPTSSWLPDAFPEPADHSILLDAAVTGGPTLAAEGTAVSVFPHGTTTMERALPSDYLGFQLFSPHYQPVCGAIRATREQGLSFVQDQLQFAAPLDPYGLADCVVALQPQRFSEYASFIRYPSSWDVPPHRTVAVILDLSHVGGHYFAAALPGQLSMDELTAFAAPHCSEVFDNLQVFLGFSTVPCGHTDDLALTPGVVITVLRADVRPMPGHDVLDLFHPGAAWGRTAHLPMPSASPGPVS